MSELFKFIEKKEVDNEQCWTYSIEFEFIFNKLTINQITITDYTWKNKKGREKITKELVLDIFREKLNKAILTSEPKKNPHWKRDHYVLKRIPFGDKKYKLVFWFKNGTTNHLWVRNCHEQD
jgi:hypothetical protein